MRKRPVYRQPAKGDCKHGAALLNAGCPGNTLLREPQSRNRKRRGCLQGRLLCFQCLPVRRYSGVADYHRAAPFCAEFRSAIAPALHAVSNSEFRSTILSLACATNQGPIIASACARSCAGE
jgi:hypothetical protein